MQQISLKILLMNAANVARCKRLPLTVLLSCFARYDWSLELRQRAMCCVTRVPSSRGDLPRSMRTCVVLQSSRIINCVPVGLCINKALKYNSVFDVIESKTWLTWIGFGQRRNNSDIILPSRKDAV